MSWPTLPPTAARWHGTSDFESDVLLLRRGEKAKRSCKVVPAQADGHLADLRILVETIASDAIDGFVYYQHGSMQTEHRTQRPHDDDATVFVCGHLATAALVELGARPNVILNPCLSRFE